MGKEKIEATRVKNAGSVDVVGKCITTSRNIFKVVQKSSSVHAQIVLFHANSHLQSPHAVESCQQ